jgi:SHS2 domain-containing protein
MQRDFEQLPHTADIKIRAYGATLQELFKHALIAMFQCIKPHAVDCKTVNDRLVCPRLPIVRELKISSPDIQALLVDFLSEALTLSDIYNEAYLDADIRAMNDTQLHATLHGTRITGFDVVEIKAVTYHELSIKQVDGLWQAEIVFDI